MPIDPSIPLLAGNRGGFSLADIMQQAEQSDAREQQLALQRQQAERLNAETMRQQQARSSLSDLLATRKPDGSYDMTSPAAAQYRQADPQGYYQIIDKLDSTQREHAKAGLADMSGAIRWADSPEKWAIVQQQLGQHDPEIAETPFEHRDQALLHLGQMSKYLDSQKIDWHPIGEQGAFATDSMGNPTGAGNPFAGGAPAPAPQNMPSGSPLARPQPGSSPKPAGMTDEQIWAQAHEAVRNGANADEVFRRLQAWGMNP